VVGNILGRKNSNFVTTSETKKNSYQNYDYDDLNRLVSADGQYTKESWQPFFDNRTNSYTNAFSYDTIGNITSKNQVNKALYPDTGELKTLINTTYNRAYSYTGKQPHAVTRAGELSFTYDANGNMLTKTNNNYKTTLNLSWDDENRLTKTIDSSGTTEYKYDDAGKRIVKKGKYGEAVYIDSNYTVRNGNVEGKHVFAGQTRIASKLCDKDSQGLDETGVYYFHGDHLGSSSVITDEAGRFFETLEYFPYGETWVKEGSESKSLPFKYTGKEEDPETGLYYYGSRYYDAKVSRWCSVDPALGDYLPLRKDKNDIALPGIGGVYRPSNLTMYQYAGNNPVMIKDPNGLFEIYVDNDSIGHLGISIKGKRYDIGRYKGHYKNNKILKYAGSNILIRSSKKTLRRYMKRNKGVVYKFNVSKKLDVLIAKHFSKVFNEMAKQIPLKVRKNMVNNRVRLKYNERYSGGDWGPTGFLGTNDNCVTFTYNTLIDALDGVISNSNNKELVGEAKEMKYIVQRAFTFTPVPSIVGSNLDWQVKNSEGKVTEEMNYNKSKGKGK